MNFWQKSNPLVGNSEEKSKKKLWKRADNYFRERSKFLFLFYFENKRARVYILFTSLFLFHHM